MAQQTAVEWLAEKYNYVFLLRNRDQISPQQSYDRRARYLEEAKEMEKEIIINFHKWMIENDTIENAEKYFGYSDEDMLNEYLSK